MPYKVFQNNVSLTAEDVNDYLMEQAVPVFINAAERDNAIPAPNGGQQCHLLSTKRNMYYDVSAGWVELLPGVVSGATARTILVCTSTTRPTQVPGRMIFETDTARTFMSDGTTWQRIHMGDSGTIDMTVAAGWTVGAEGCSYRRIGGVVYFQGVFARPAGNWPAGALLTTFPLGFRPSRTHWWQGTWGGVIVPEIKVNPDGNFFINAAQTLAGVVVSGSFPIV